MSYDSKRTHWDNCGMIANEMIGSKPIYLLGVDCLQGSFFTLRRSPIMMARKMFIYVKRNLEVESDVQVHMAHGLEKELGCLGCPLLWGDTSTRGEGAKCGTVPHCKHGGTFGGCVLGDQLRTAT